jgi:transposase
MGRRRTRVELSPAETRRAQRLVRSGTDAREVERARFALLAASGRHTMEALAGLVGRQRSTLQTWLAKFQSGGLERLLERETSPGLASPIAEPTIQRQLQTGLAQGRWSSAAQVAAWLHRTHGIKRSRKSIYYWLQKYGNPAPQGRHRSSPGSS